jgi:hypothetical protein
MYGLNHLIMKINKYRAISLMVLCCSVASSQVNAQNEDDIGRFLSAGKADASKLITAYTEPIVKSMSYGMTGGWYNTAKTHKSLGFDIGFTISVASVPTSENFFNPNSLGLQSNVTFVNNSRSSQDKAPTIVGPKDDTQYTFSGDLDGDSNTPDNNITVTGPEGFDLKKEIKFAGMPMPMIQVGIGIIKNTDLKLRLVPKQTFGSSELKMFGLGVMHDVKQHLKGIKLLPFDLSVLVAFNSVSGSSSMVNSNSSTGPVSTDGELEYKFNSYVFQALVSKKVSVLTGYAGVGYTFNNTNIDVRGTYDIAATPASFQLTNPLAIDFKNKSVRMTAGIRLKLGPLYFVGDYTLQKYNTLTVGMGFAFR